MKLDQIDAVTSQSVEAALDRAGHGGFDVIEFVLAYHHLRADEDLRLEFRQDTAEIRLRQAVTINGCGVEVVDAQLHGAGDCPDHFGGVATHQQPADRAAAEAEGRDSQAGAA